MTDSKTMYKIISVFVIYMDDGRNNRENVEIKVCRSEHQAKRELKKYEDEESRRYKEAVDGAGIIVDCSSPFSPEIPGFKHKRYHIGNSEMLQSSPHGDKHGWLLDRTRWTITEDDEVVTAAKIRRAEALAKLNPEDCRILGLNEKKQKYEL